MGASEKKSSEAAFDVPTLNAENLQSNMKVIYYRFVWQPHGPSWNLFYVSHVLLCGLVKPQNVAFYVNPPVMYDKLSG